MADKYPLFNDLKYLNRHLDEIKKFRIENCVGSVPVPVGIAGPLRLKGPNTPSDNFYAPLATSEAALVASCSRGCKAFSMCGGIRFEVLEDCMSRAPFFVFPSPHEATSFVRVLPRLQPHFAEDAKLVSRHAELQRLTPHIIGSTVHVRFDFHCGDAAGQNMATIATQKCCDKFMASDLARELKVQRMYVEGQMTADKKPSQGNVAQTRGVRTVCWGMLTDEVCQSVLKCSTESLYECMAFVKEAEIRNGQFGSTINAANVVTAMFIACGQDAACAVDAAWCHLTPEYNHRTRELKLSMFFPSLPVGVIGGGTQYEAQRECLKILNCDGPGMKSRLAGCVAAFALALDASTCAAITNNTFARAHETLRKAKI